MRHHHETKFNFLVFDIYPTTPRLGYYDRTCVLLNQITPGFVDKLIPRVIRDYNDYLKYAAEVLPRHEGICLRHADSPYKHGHSTWNEHYLLAVKPFADSEAVVVDYTEALENTNESVTNERGLSERSHSKAGKVGKNTLGSLLVRCPHFLNLFEIGTGFTAEQRQELWNLRDSGLRERLVKFKYQAFGSTTDAPRCPVFLGFRDPRDT